MRAVERLELAHLSYQRAIATARAASTPATWRRLLTARMNLDAARLAREFERERGRRHDGRERLDDLGFGALGRTNASVGRIAGTELRAGSAADLEAAPWAALLREWARAQALMEWSAVLVAQARALERSRAQGWW